MSASKPSDVHRKMTVGYVLNAANPSVQTGSPLTSAPQNIGLEVNRDAPDVIELTADDAAAVIKARVSKDELAQARQGLPSSLRADSAPTGPARPVDEKGPATSASATSTTSNKSHTKPTKPVVDSTKMAVVNATVRAAFGSTGLRFIPREEVHQQRGVPQPESSRIARAPPPMESLREQQQQQQIRQKPIMDAAAQQQSQPVFNNHASQQPMPYPAHRGSVHGAHQQNQQVINAPTPRVSHRPMPHPGPPQALNAPTLQANNRFRPYPNAQAAQPALKRNTNAWRDQQGRDRVEAMNVRPASLDGRQMQPPRHEQGNMTNGRSAVRRESVGVSNGGMVTGGTPAQTPSRMQRQGPAQNYEGAPHREQPINRPRPPSPLLSVRNDHANGVTILTTRSGESALIDNIPYSPHELEDLRREQESLRRGRAYIISLSELASWKISFGRPYSVFEQRGPSLLPARQPPQQAARQVPQLSPQQQFSSPAYQCQYRPQPQAARQAPQLAPRQHFPQPAYQHPYQPQPQAARQVPQLAPQQHFPQPAYQHQYRLQSQAARQVPQQPPQQPLPPPSYQRPCQDPPQAHPQRSVFQPPPQEAIKLEANIKREDNLDHQPRDLSISPSPPPPPPPPPRPAQRRWQDRYPAYARATTENANRARRVIDEDYTPERACLPCQERGIKCYQGTHGNSRICAFCLVKPGKVSGSKICFYGDEELDDELLGEGEEGKGEEGKDEQGEDEPGEDEEDEFGGG